MAFEREKKREVAFFTGINPYFIDEKPPSSDFRELKRGYKTHGAKLKPWIVYDENKGGLIACKWCEAFSVLAPTDAIAKGWHVRANQRLRFSNLESTLGNRDHEKCRRHFNVESVLEIKFQLCLKINCKNKQNSWRRESFTSAKTCEHSTFYGQT